MSDTQPWIAELVEAWRTNHRINLYLIDHISDEGMKCTLSKRGGRNVVRQFCHLHNVRLWHLEARAKDLSKGLYKFATEEEPDKERLKENLVASAQRIEEFLEQAAAGAARRRPFKKGVASIFAYFVAHDSHHRGNILLTLKQCGHKIDPKAGWAIWEWDKM